MKSTTLSKFTGSLIIFTWFFALMYRAMEMLDWRSGYGASEDTLQVIPVKSVLWADGVNVLLCFILLYLGVKVAKGDFLKATFIFILCAKVIAMVADYLVRDLTPSHFWELSIISFIFPAVILSLLGYQLYPPSKKKKKKLQEA